MVAEPCALRGIRDHPYPRATGGMASTSGTSSEDSARTPVCISRASEEQEEEEAATPISAGTPTGPVKTSSALPPSASDISGFAAEAFDPDDESRPVTNQEFTAFRHSVEQTNTFQRRHAGVMSLMHNELGEQDCQRDALK